jgi:hypothetical protein
MPISSGGDNEPSGEPHPLARRERAQRFSICERVQTWFSWAPAEVVGWFPGVNQRRWRRMQRRNDELRVQFGPPPPGDHILDETGYHLQPEGMARPVTRALGVDGRWTDSWPEGPAGPDGGVREPRRPLPKPVSGSGAREPGPDE